MNMNTEITEKSLTSFIELELAECDIISALSDEPCVYRPGRRFQLEKEPLRNFNKNSEQCSGGGGVTQALALQRDIPYTFHFHNTLETHSPPLDK